MTRRLAILITVLLLTLVAPAARALLGTHTLVVYAGGHMIAIKGALQGRGEQAGVLASANMRDPSGQRSSEAPRGLDGQAEMAQDDLRRLPSISAAQIDSILASYGSPATGQGQAFYALGARYGIDPAYALAFFIHESTAGTNPGWAGLKPDGSTTHNIGNVICAGYPTCFGCFRDYSDWAKGIEDWYALLTNEYFPRGLTTVEAIVPVYAPSSDNNNVGAYVSAVNGMVEGWRVASSEASSPDR
jgi:hypothetical protein